MKDPIVIFGGSGFVGTHLTNALKNIGYDTVAVDIVPSHNYVNGDIRDFDICNKMCNDAGTVFHLAGELPPHGWSKGKKGEMWDTMVNGTKNVLEASLRNNINKVVYFSSSAVYGVPPDYPLKEDAPHKPLDEYGKAKQRAEELCREYLDKGLNITIIRPMTILGNNFVGILRSMMEFIYRGKKLYILGSGKNKIQLIHIDDVINASILAADSKKSMGEVFNIASHGPPTVREELEELIKYANSKSRIVSLPSNIVRTFLILVKKMGVAAMGKEIYTLADKDFILSTKRAEHLLGWKPKYNNIDALKVGYDWFASNHDKAKPILSIWLKLAMFL